jgi:hypothetical protein
MCLSPGSDDDRLKKLKNNESHTKIANPKNARHTPHHTQKIIRLN